MRALRRSAEFAAPPLAGTGPRTKTGLVCSSGARRGACPSQARRDHLDRVHPAAVKTPGGRRGGPLRSRTASRRRAHRTGPRSPSTWTSPSPQTQRVQVDLVPVDQALLGEGDANSPLPCMNRAEVDSPSASGSSPRGPPQQVGRLNIVERVVGPDVLRHLSTMSAISPTGSASRPPAPRRSGGPARARWTWPDARTSGRRGLRPAAPSPTGRWTPSTVAWVVVIRFPISVHLRPRELPLSSCTDATKWTRGFDGPAAARSALERPDSMGSEAVQLILSRNLLSAVELAAFIIDPDGTVAFFDDSAGQFIGRRPKRSAAGSGERSSEYGPLDEFGQLLPPIRSRSRWPCGRVCRERLFHVRLRGGDGAGRGERAAAGDHARIPGGDRGLLAREE